MKKREPLGRKIHAGAEIEKWQLHCAGQRIESDVGKDKTIPVTHIRGISSEAAIT